MIKFILISALLVAAVYSFAVENNEDIAQDAEQEIMSEEARRSLPPGSECDGDKSDCQCYGKWHKCGCPWFGGKCTCQKGYKYTCITKLSCPNKDEWGLDWRSEESERSPC